MISPRKLVKMARIWPKDATKSCYHERVTNKGHFVAYTTDKNRFVIPLSYLKTDVFRELLRMSEDEFGLPTDGPIVVVCDSSLMSFLIKMVERGFAK